MTSAIARVAAKQSAPAAHATTPARKHRRGPAPLPAHELRGHTVSVRMNAAERDELDAQCRAAGGHQRGEQLRMAWRGQAAAVMVPEANRVAYAALARSAANLTQISERLGVWDAELRTRIATAERELQAFRLSMLSTETTGSGDARTDERVSVAATREERRKRRGPIPLPTGQARRLVVAVRLNAEELASLDSQRRANDAKRGEWLRMVWEELRKDAHIAAVTEQAYENLERSADNINSLAKYLNEGSELKGRLPLIAQEVEAFIRNLHKAIASKE
jgi:hypothetical protein